MRREVFIMQSDVFAVIDREEHMIKAGISEVHKTYGFTTVGSVDCDLVVKPKKKVPTLEELGYSFEMGM
jgi:hypothetical protein